MRLTPLERNALFGVRGSPPPGLHTHRFCRCRRGARLGRPRARTSRCRPRSGEFAKLRFLEILHLARDSERPAILLLIVPERLFSLACEPLALALGLLVEIGEKTRVIDGQNGVWQSRMGCGQGVVANGKNGCAACLPRAQTAFLVCLSTQTVALPRSIASLAIRETLVEDFEDDGLGTAQPRDDGAAAIRTAATATRTVGTATRTVGTATRAVGTALGRPLAALLPTSLPTSLPLPAPPPPPPPPGPLASRNSLSSAHERLAGASSHRSQSQSALPGPSAPSTASIV